MSQIVFNAVDQGEIAKAAAQLYLNIENKLPPVPWLSNSGQQDAFRSTVKLITDEANALRADDCAKYAIIFWALTILYANNAKFRVATKAAQRISELMKVYAVELTFLEWIGSETHPGVVVAASMPRWQNRNLF